MDSRSRNHYKCQQTGDSHCPRVRIVIVVNSTFTGGGLSSPLFVVVYGFTEEELPDDEIVTIKIPGLTVGSEQDVYSNGSGYIIFVCGKFEEADATDGEDIDMNVDEDVTSTNSSREVIISALYCELVYDPFIRHICMTHYGWSGDGEVPDLLKDTS